MLRMSKDEYYLNIAKAVAQRSTCLKRRYGCVIVKDDEIISTGYNGSPRGFTNCCDTNKCDRMDKPHNSGDYSDCCSVHAEQNAIISASRSEMLGATMYLTGEDRLSVVTDGDEESLKTKYAWKEIERCTPCPICARMILNCGLRVVNRMGTLKIEKFAHKERI